MATGGGENPEIGVVNQKEPNERPLVAEEEERGRGGLQVPAELLSFH